jgi:hypothetical protein
MKVAAVVADAHVGGEHEGVEERAALPAQCLAQRVRGQNAGLLRGLEARRLAHVAAKHERGHAERSADEERDAPAEVRHLRVRQDGVEDRDQGRGDQHADARGEMGRGRRITTTVLARGLGEGHQLAAEFPTHREARDQAQDEKEGGCGPADLVVGREQADRQNRQRHQDERQQQRASAPIGVPVAPEEDRPERSDQELGGEDAEGGQQRPQLAAGDILREEQLGHHRRQVRVEHEVVPLEGGAGRDVQLRAQRPPRLPAVVIHLGGHTRDGDAPARYVPLQLLERIGHHRKPPAARPRPG